MRILFLVDSYAKGTRSSDKMVHDLGLVLSRRGHRVTILAPSDRIASTFAVEEVGGMRIVFVRAATTKGVPRAVRALRESQLSLRAWRNGRQFFAANAFDLIVFYSPSIFWSGLVAKLKALYSCPAYLVLRDMFPQWAIDLGILRSRVAERWFRHKELQQYAVADVVAVQSHANLDYFSRFGERRFRLEVLHNWSQPEEVTRRRPSVREQLRVGDKLLYVYGGNIGVAQDMPNLLRLAERLAPRRDVFFLFVGEGSEVESSQRWIEAKGLTSVRILPPLDQAEYLALISECDVGLISLDRRLTTHNFPGKLLGYMQCSLPIVASMNAGNDLAEVLNNARAGLCSVNGDDSAFVVHALALAESPALRKELGGNAKRLLLERFTADRACDQLLQHVRPLLSAAERQPQTPEWLPAA